MAALVSGISNKSLQPIDKGRSENVILVAVRKNSIVNSRVKN